MQIGQVGLQPAQSLMPMFPTLQARKEGAALPVAVLPKGSFTHDNARMWA